MTEQTEDNILNPNGKRRWSTGGSVDAVTVGDKTVEQTGGVETIRTLPEAEEATNNGGGTKSRAKKADADKE